MKILVFFLEEFSAKVMLEGFITAHFPGAEQKVSLQYKVHEGKQDKGFAQTGTRNVERVVVSK
jgi:hypothetical protein